MKKWFSNWKTNLNHTAIEHGISLFNNDEYGDEDNGDDNDEDDTQTANPTKN